MIRLAGHPHRAQPPRESLRVVVLGYIVRGPMGGMTWHHLHYVLGLHRLGHEVLFVEDSDDYASCYDPQRYVMDTDPAFGLRFASDAFQRLGLANRWCYFDGHTQRWHGPAAATGEAFCREADVVLNVSGVNPLRPWWSDAPVRALIDTDPLFTQVRHLEEPARRAFALAHTHFLTFGENLPAGSSTVPDDGLPWQATRQPIVLDAWPAAPPRPASTFRTVMQWESYPPRIHAGVSYGMKSRAFQDYLDLPAMTAESLELSVGGEQAPRDELIRRGWRLTDPLVVACDPWAYQHYVSQAKGEWSVAKHGYVASRSGWFSERSACFLASGRPVVLQDTGFSDILPTGRGLLTFTTAAGAAEALAQVGADYNSHCATARQIACDFFDAPLVLNDLINHLSAAPPAGRVAASAL